MKRIFFYRCHQVVLWLLQIKLYKSNASSYVIVRMYPSFKSSWNIICSLTSYYLRCGSLHALQRFSSKGGLRRNIFRWDSSGLFDLPVMSVLLMLSVCRPPLSPLTFWFICEEVFSQPDVTVFFLPAFFKELLSFR